MSTLDDRKRWALAQSLSFKWKKAGFCRTISRKESAELLLWIFKTKGLPEESFE